MSLMWLACVLHFFFFFFKQKTAYEMRISDWSSDVCSSDLKHTWLTRILSVAALALLAGCASNPTTTAELERARDAVDKVASMRSEERRVGKECVSTCRSRWSPYPYKTKKTNYIK